MDSNLNEPTEFSNLVHLSAEKLQQLETVLKSILALPIAQDTYAQIIDGKSTPQSDSDPDILSFPTETASVSPSDAAIQQYDEIRKAFKAWKLFIAKASKIDTQLNQRYQNAPLGSREHTMRLLEITAASVHVLAGMIYAAFHPDTDTKPPKPPARHLHAFAGTEHFYVDFYHDGYIQFKDYPFGLLNVVGYWAEAQLFGGVLLFDRGDSGLEINNAFVDPQWSSEAFQLSSQQIARFSDLSKSEDAALLLGAGTLLPFAQEPHAHTEKVWIRQGDPPLRIYKNEYDKPPPSIFPAWRCVHRATRQEPMVIEDPHSSLENLPPLKVDASK